MAGTLYGIGVGPGDPEYLTLKAVRIMKECDIIAIPAAQKDNCVAYRIARQAVPEIENKEILGVVMPMTKEKDLLEKSHKEGTEIIIKKLKEGKTMAFLTLGDPTVYSTYMYIHKGILEKGHKAEIISGIPSFCAVAARLNRSLSENSEELHIIPGSYGINKALELSGTKVLMKAGKRFAEVKQQLLASGQKAAMIENCGMEGEKIYPSLKEFPDQAGYYSLMIVKEDTVI